jgi:pimeloyl-ACP methyl ester carboxylesterase
MTPSFHSLGSFAAWLGSCYDLQRFGCIVGHSLGGLAALEWLSSSSRTPAHLVLVETFLLPPPPFFRNVLLEEKKPAERRVQKMLSDEKLYYSPVLAERLRWIDMMEHVAPIASRVHALYGDRGCGKPAEVAAELRWPEGLSECIDLHVIPNACHFPMVENPAATADVLQQILG